MEQPINEMLGKMLADQQAEQSETEKRIRAAHEAMNQQVTDAQAELMKGFLSKREQKPELPAEIQGIVNALLAQPRLVAPVNQFLSNLVSRINAAVDAQIAEALGPSNSP